MSERGHERGQEREATQISKKLIGRGEHARLSSRLRPQSPAVRHCPPPQLLLDAQLLVLPINMASGVVEARRLR